MVLLGSVLISFLALTNSNAQTFVFEMPVNPDEAYLIQKYDVYNLTAEGYHTGIDLYTKGGKPTIYPTAPGVVMIIQPNGPCSDYHGEGGGCEDHGLGNTVIIEHIVEDGQPIYSLYAHLDSINPSLHEGSVVGHSDPVGIMGASGYGLSDYWKNSDGTPAVHLHFEIKNRAALSNPKGEGIHFGYVPSSADNYGYHNPYTFTDRVEDIIVTEQAKPLPTGFTAQEIVAESFQYPLEGYVVSGYEFGENVNGKYHLGEDVIKPAGTKVYACGNGVVKLANNEHSGKGNYGGLIIVEHTLSGGNKGCSLYGHLDDSKTLVRPGAIVEKGQEIGEIGRRDPEINGDSIPHLHFGTRDGEFVGESASDPNTTSGWYWAGYGKVDPWSMYNWWTKPSFLITVSQSPQYFEKLALRLVQESMSQIVPQISEQLQTYIDKEGEKLTEYYSTELDKRLEDIYSKIRLQISSLQHQITELENEIQALKQKWETSELIIKQAPEQRIEPQPTLPTSTSPLIIEIPMLSLNLPRMKIYEMKEIPVKGDLIFLLRGKEGVNVIGPEISSSSRRELELDSIFYLANEEISKYEEEEEGYIVRVNPYLAYDIVIGDLEGEIDLARVELSKETNIIKSNFIFLASAQAGGIVTVKITAIVNRKGVAISGPIGIEVRSTREPGVTTQQLIPTTETLSLGLPTKAVIDFYTLWFVKKSYDEAEKLLTPEMLKEMEAEGGLEQIAENYYREFQKPLDIVVIKEEIQDATAIVTAIFLFNGERGKSSIFLRKINNEWKIASP